MQSPIHSLTCSIKFSIFILRLFISFDETSEIFYLLRLNLISETKVGDWILEYCKHSYSILVFAFIHDHP